MGIAYHKADKVGMYYIMGTLLAKLGHLSNDIMCGNHDYYIWMTLESAERDLARMKERIGKHRPSAPPMEAKRERTEHSKG